ncbi:hypothetical protein KQI86_19490 [Clostridium sp. MSJ-11]|uniref:Uncharacterized protein n=1 Tax=Clostridium mobile TaxID=2841512 RepID=A0ABS6EMN0_9CLOT|nr:hypothetical protein [Clostridium mobile]MBU5486488.1 hypothetical protein [Clostridium mobile]
MDYIEVGQAIYDTSKRIEKGVNAITEKAKEYAENEKKYRIALAKEIMKLKAEGLQATLIPDVARGNVADLKFKRDLSELEYKAYRDMIEGLKAELSGLQTIYRRLEDM